MLSESKIQKELVDKLLIENLSFFELDQTKSQFKKDNQKLVIHSNIAFLLEI